MSHIESKVTYWEAELDRYRSAMKSLTDFSQFGYKDEHIAVLQQAVGMIPPVGIRTSPEAALELLQDASGKPGTEIELRTLVPTLLLYLEYSARIDQAEQKLLQLAEQAKERDERIQEIREQLDGIDLILDKYAEERGAKPLHSRSRRRAGNEDEQGLDEGIGN